MSEWQPIETAPSLEWVLLWTPPTPAPYHYPEDDALNSGKTFRRNVQWVGWKDERGYWNAYYSGVEPHEPTHWMPLQTPPAL